MRTPEAQAVAESAIRLMQGVVYEESDPETWSALLNHRPHVRDHFDTIGVDVVIDDAEGYAYLRSQEPDDGEEPLPRLVKRRSLPYYDSLLLVLLRKRMVEFESRGDEGRLVVHRSEITEMMRIFLGDSSDEARTESRIDTSISRISDLGFLRPLRGQQGTWEVRRIVKAYVDAQTLHDFSAKLQEYAAELERNGQ